MYKTVTHDILPFSTLCTVGLPYELHLTHVYKILDIRLFFA